MAFYNLDVAQRTLAAKAGMLQPGPHASQAETAAARAWPAATVPADQMISNYLGLQTQDTALGPDPETAGAASVAQAHRTTAGRLEAALAVLDSYAGRHEEALTVAFGRANAAARKAAADTAARVAAEQNAVNTAVDAAQRAADALGALTADGFVVPPAATERAAAALAAAETAVTGGPGRVAAAGVALTEATSTETVCAAVRERWSAGGIRTTTLRTRIEVLDSKTARAQQDLERLATGWTVSAWYPVGYGARRARTAIILGKAGLATAVDTLGRLPRDTDRLSAALAAATRAFDEADAHCTAVRARTERLNACKTDPVGQAKPAGFAVREAARFITEMPEPRKSPLAVRQNEIASRYDRARSVLRQSPGRPDLGAYLDRLDEAQAAAEALLTEARSPSRPAQADHPASTDRPAGNPQTDHHKGRTHL